MEWLIFGSLVTIWSVRVLEAAHALGFLDIRSQRSDGTNPDGSRDMVEPRQRQRRRARRAEGGWRREYVGHLSMGETSINDFRRVLQMLDRKNKNPASESVDWKKEGF